MLKTQHLITSIWVLAIFHLHAMTCDVGAQAPDAETLLQAGIRTIKSRHLTLYTDLPASEGVDELPRVFDLAVPQWQAFFSSDAERLQDWHVTACIMRDGQRFKDYRLLPSGLPQFLHGLQRGDRLWVWEQRTEYYRRHLLLHEGTHAVMNRIYGRVGPVWYREGIADLLATHTYHDGRLQLNIFPEDKRELENSGRIHVIREEVSKRGILQIDQIVSLPTRSFLNIDSYAWAWALQSFLQCQEKYAAIRSSLIKEMEFSDVGVTETFLREYQKNRTELDYEWNLFVQHLDYGYDSSWERIQFAPKVIDLRDDGIHTIQIDAAKGWQSAGIRVAANEQLDVAARGKFQVATEVSESQPPAVWHCEPQGVTIEYYQGRPLGQLLAAIVPEDASAKDSRFDAVGIGRRGKMSTKTGGQLFFRINERADRMADNMGQITVKLRLAKPR